MAGRNDSGGALLGPLGCFDSSVRFVLVFVWRFVCFLSVRFVLFLFFLVVVSVLFLLLFFCFIFWCSFWFSCSILLLFSGVHFVSFLFCSGGSLIPICFFLHYFALLLCVYLIQCSSYPRVCSNVCSVLFILPPCPFIRCVFCAFFVRF